MAWPGSAAAIRRCRCAGDNDNGAEQEREIWNEVCSCANSIAVQRLLWGRTYFKYCINKSRLQRRRLEIRNECSAWNRMCAQMGSDREVKFGAIMAVYWCSASRATRTFHPQILHYDYYCSWYWRKVYWHVYAMKIALTPADTRRSGSEFEWETVLLLLSSMQSPIHNLRFFENRFSAFSWSSSDGQPMKIRWRMHSKLNLEIYNWLLSSSSAHLRNRSDGLMLFAMSNASNVQRLSLAICVRRLKFKYNPHRN